MNYVDLIIVLVVLIALWSGWNKGFIAGTFDLLSWIGSILAAFLMYKPFAALIDDYFPSLGSWAAPISFIIILIISRLILTGLFYRFIPVSRETHQNQANRALGLIPGAVNGVINAAIVAALLLAIPFSNDLSAETRESKSAQMLTPKVEWLEDKLSPVFHDAMKKSINNMVVDPESKKTVNLKFTTTNVKTREDLEGKMIILVNEERKKQGLNALTFDPELTKVARLHSQDMFAKGYFSHYSPEGSTVADRLKTGGVKYLVAGENLALAQTLSIAHNGLMESPGHKANILHLKYGRIGIGVLDGGRYGLMITQVFKN
jgi:uncharacterized protein YkwD